MKVRIFPGRVLGVILAGGMITPGFAQSSPDASPALVSSNNAAAAIATAPALAEPGPGAAQPPPPAQQLTPGALDIQRLAQAQVDEGVILACVTNSPGTFNVTADQIILLKQAGVTPQVISAMIRHDQESPSRARPGIVAGTPVVAEDASRASDILIAEDDYYAPEQPENIGPVRAPYPVKLNDPIVILKLPTLSVPYW